jgi:hypothetical protein
MISVPLRTSRAIGLGNRIAQPTSICISSDYRSGRTLGYLSPGQIRDMSTTRQWTIACHDDWPYCGLTVHGTLRHTDPASAILRLLNASFAIP